MAIPSTERARHALPLTHTEPRRPGPLRPVPSRAADRQITFGGVLVAVAFAAAAALAGIWSVSGGTGWLPLHLALAGAAGGAVAAVLPFFTTALAQAAPAHPGLRIAGVVLVAGGTAVAALGMTSAGSIVATAGGASYLAGLVAVALAAFMPLRGRLGFRLRLVHVAYGVALVQVATGVFLATAMLSAWAPVARAWLALKPAHAWLNVFGFVVVVVAASLAHLAPTVAGARIRPRGSMVVALVGLMVGAPLVAIGYATGWDVVGRAGAAIELVGAGALVAHGVAVQRERGAWTTDPGWHRFAGFSLLTGTTWLLVGVAIAAGRVLWLGSTPASWSVATIAVPLVVGGIGQVLMGSWTHLIPAIGPGDQARHAGQRSWLGRAALRRWSAWNVGTAMATVGGLAGSDVLFGAGALALGAGLAVDITLLVGSIVAVERRGGRAPSSRD